MNRALISLCVLLLAIVLVSAAPGVLKIPVVDTQATGGYPARAVAYDPAKKKLYAGIECDQIARRGLLVFDVKDDGSLVVPPRRWPVFPRGIPWRNVTVSCLLLDTGHHALFVGVTSQDASWSLLIRYQIDGQGYPMESPEWLTETGGPPRGTLGVNPIGSNARATFKDFNCSALALHPRLNRLYVAGSGGIFAFGLDKRGRAFRVEGVQLEASPGKRGSIFFRADGTKLYVGAAPSTLEVYDLDKQGNVIGQTRAYPVKDGGNEALVFSASDRAVFFKGPQGELGYFTLGQTGEPTSGPIAAEITGVQAVTMSSKGDRLLIGVPTSFTDAISGKVIGDGVQVEELALGAGGLPGNVLRASAPLKREAVIALTAAPGIALAANSLGDGFLGNQFSGLQMRATLEAATASDAMPDGGLSASFGIGDQTYDCGRLTVGGATKWVNLDAALKDGVGLLPGTLTLWGATITKATVKFEAIRAEEDTVKPVATVSSTVLGDKVRLFLPRYGEDPQKLASLVQTTGTLYRKYLDWALPVALKPEERPRQFVVANSLIGMDGSPESLECGMEALGSLGMNTIQAWNFSPITAADLRAAAERNGFTRHREATAYPTAYFDYVVEAMQKDFLDKWADEFAASAVRLGGKPEEVALMHVADEPGWYYPVRCRELKGEVAVPPGWSYPPPLNKETLGADRMAVFHSYLKGKGLTPDFFGKATWDEVQPSSLSLVTALPEKRLFYWTIRFFTESFSRGMAAATSALQRRLNPNVLTTANFNNWPGSFYCPSPGGLIANNWDSGPDAGMGNPDWFDVGRKRGVTCMWTEDWFGDRLAQNTPMYADLLRCAAREGNLEFGSYVMGHTTGMIPDGATYKIMALAGRGAKAFDLYCFGPYYAFADGWSERPYVYGAFAEALRVLAKAEPLLYPGRPRNGTVAILFPQATQLWWKDPTRRYFLSELYGLHAALVHESYPVDFVDDVDAEQGALRNNGYAVLYVTAVNLSEKAQRTILAWVQAGGTLVLLPGAGVADEYNEPLPLLQQVMGANWGKMPRHPMPDLAELGRSEWYIVRGPFYSLVPEGRPATIRPASRVLAEGQVQTEFDSAPLAVNGGKALATFADGKAAIAEMPQGKGYVFSYGYWPGMTYWQSPDRGDSRRLPEGWSASARQMIAAPAHLAGAKKYVEISSPLVEGTLLESDKGLAVTLLNWSGDPMNSITVAVPGFGRVVRVSSVRQGTLKYKVDGDKLTVSLPLRTVDVLMIE